MERKEHIVLCFINIYAQTFQVRALLLAYSARLHLAPLPDMINRTIYTHFGDKKSFFAFYYA